MDRLRRERNLIASQQTASSAEIEQRRQELASAEEQAALSEQSLHHLEASLATTTEEMLEIEQQLQQLELQRSADQLDLAKQGERLEAMRAQSNRLQEELGQRQAQYEEAERRCQASHAKRQQILLNILNTRALRDELLLANEHVFAASTALHARKLALRVERSQLVEQELAIRKERRELSDRRHAEEMRVRDIRHALDQLNERLDEEYQIKLDEVVASGASAVRLIIEERQARAEAHSSKGKGHKTEAAEVTEGDDEEATPEPSVSTDGLTFSEVTFAEVRPEIEARVNRLRKQLKLMGAVNTDSLRDLEMLETRFTQLSSQLQDLVEAKNTLEDIIRKINGESRRLFAETFDTIRTNFQELFRQVFGGGEGDIILEDPNDVLDCGIDIAARPPGKELRSISLLSGGEKTMTAIALIMAIFRSKPSPFCILDEVDAALDEANVERFTAVVQAFRQSTQFIMITHHKRSMTVADVLYGVTMEESGVSKRMSVRFEDVSDDGNFKSPQSSAA